MKKPKGIDAIKSSFTTAEINEHIKDYMISFIENFSSSEKDMKNIQYRRTTIELVKEGKKVKLPVTITTSADKDEEGVVRRVRFTVF